MATKKVGKYEVGRVLGEGTFGLVKLAVHTESKERVAMKILDRQKIEKQEMQTAVKRELTIMKSIKHPNVVNLREVLSTSKKIYIVLDLVTGGELFDKIVNAPNGRLTENQARFYFRQLLDGMVYCHDQGVCHRDLKPENLLLDGDGNLKVSDFGLSKMIDVVAKDSGIDDKAKLTYTMCGTPNYVAPEVLEEKGYDGRSSDIWSCGVILYVLMAGFMPFDEPTMAALFDKIKKADFKYPSWFSDGAIDLINRILVPDPEERLSIKQISEHSWVKEGDGESFGPVETNPDLNVSELGSAPMSPAPPQHTTAPSTALESDQAASAGGSGAVGATVSGGPGSVAHQGWIHKKGGGKSLFGRRNWKLRYCKLSQHDDGLWYLEYYGAPEDKIPKGSKCMRGALALAVENKHHPDKCCFDVTTPPEPPSSEPEVNNFWSESQQDRDVWIKAIIASASAQ